MEETWKSPAVSAHCHHGCFNSNRRRVPRMLDGVLKYRRSFAFFMTFKDENKLI